MYSFFLTTADGATGTGGDLVSSLISLLIPIGLLVVMYFILIRPQKKQEKQVQQMRDELQVGDEVTTVGGIIGEVISIKEDTFILETGRDRTRIRFHRWAIKSVDVKADQK